MLLLACTLALPAQNTRDRRVSSRTSEDDNKGAWIHGSVVNDRTGAPLLRAQVILRPVTGATSGVVVETDEHGNFVMNRISPGAYSITAQRDGFLPNSNGRRGTMRFPPVLQLNEGYHLRGVVFRLRSWSVISGKIRYEDAEPAVGAAVQLYREAVTRGRRSMQLAGSARANDKGEFRIHGLQPGAYFVAATRNRAAGPELDEQEALDETGRSVTEFRHATTFYPASQRLADAVAVHVESGQEVSAIDIDLKPVPAVRIRGEVINGVTGQKVQGPNLVFRRMAADGQSSIPVALNLKPWKEGFEITGITSGPYLVTCDLEFERQRLLARQFLTVTDAPIDNLNLTLEPERVMSGVIRFDDSPRVQPSRLRVNLEPRSDINKPSVGNVNGDGNFEVKVAPGETYDAYVLNMPDSYYVKGVRIANLDVGPDGIPSSAAAPNVPLELTLSSKSATVTGRAFTPDGRPAGGATIVVVPDPVRGRGADYQATSSDEYGVFRLGGIAPGRYTVFSFYEEPPCDYYDENALLSCRSLGQTVQLTEAGQAIIEIRTR
jgi:hypothetical protein